MDRCNLAYNYFHSGLNCAQSVVCAFSDKTGLSKEASMAVSCGFGGGVGGSHTEICGAVSGAVMVLSLTHPHTDGGDAEAKKRVYALTKEFRRRFSEIFQSVRCGELLSLRAGVSDKTTAAKRLNLSAHCDIMVVTAVQLVEAMLAEEK